jgi:serine/threonine protein kinase
MTEAIEKINLNDITSTYEVKNTEAFTQYLKQVWKDLNSRSGDESSKGIDKVTFKQYYNLPGIISERLFSVFDSENTGYLSLQNFTEKMLILFSSDLDKLLQFILDFYDFDKDGKITKEDVRIVLSYVPIYKKRKNKKNEGLKFDTDDFNDRIVLQKELHEKLDNIFEKKESIDLNEFTDVIKNKNSDIFLFILVFLYEHRPFSFETVKNLENIKKSPELSPKKDIFIASPNLDSNFIVSQTLQKSPAMKNKGLNDKNKNIYKNMKYLGLLSGRNLNLEQENNNVNNNLNNNNNINKTENKVVFSLKIPTGNNNNNENMINDNNINNINEKNDLINLEEKEQKKPKRKHLKNISDKTDISEENKKYDDENEEEEIMNFSYARPFEGRDIPKNSEKNNSNEKNNIDTDDENDEEDSNKIIEEDQLNENKDDITEGYLYKIQANKMKKIYFRLICKDLYYYKSKDTKKHKGMHNLSGVYIKDLGIVTINEKKLYCFNIIFPSKERKYYLQNESEYIKWVESIRKVVNYSNINDLYEIKGTLGKGKFGKVKLGVHKQSGKQVAIKIINKNFLEGVDLEQIKSEIDILKIAKHPNIIKLYDVYENEKYIYIIMEYCLGGDLFSYIEKRNFKLSEERAAEIIHKLCTAVYFLHQYGIVHRDLKPENILMMDKTDNADIRLVDFGLGKMLGPGEKCNDPFGTFSYVAPEVLEEKEYDFKVDLFAIGIITYLLVAGFLPFDDENSEKEIARQTVYEPTPFPKKIWNNISPEAKMFVDNLLNKDPDKRMNLGEVLQHKWFGKFINNGGNNLNENSVFNRRKSKDLSGGDKFLAFSTTDNENIRK